MKDKTQRTGILNEHKKIIIINNNNNDDNKIYDDSLSCAV